jgi:Amt family ammonium transporter
MTTQVLSLTPLDQLWVLVTACLVFTMQAGFLCLEAGLSRAKHSMNVAVKNVTDFLISSVAFLLVGYGLMFGKSWHGVLGTTDYGFQSTLSSQVAFFVFQLMFCGCAATIVSGAMAERMKFSAYLIYSVAVSAFFYPLFGHWAWGGGYYLEHPGWLARLGYLDFAGSSVVHQMGGWLALAGITVLGPRLGKFDAQGRPQRLIGHNIPLALLGVFILWLGWFGFNGGSTLHMNDTVATIILNTNTAAAVGSLAALAIGWAYRKRPDVNDISNGCLGGLVAITASAAYVDMPATFVIGILAGLVVIASGEWMERHLKLDDVVGAVPVHGFCGLWGVLAAGLFAHSSVLLHPNNRLYHVGLQLLGSAVCFVVAYGGGWVFFTLLNRVMRIRVSPEAERQGLNLSEHQASSSVQELAETMREIAQQKNWHWRTDIDPYADTGELGIHFNRLLDTIEETFRSLGEQQRLLASSRESLTLTNQQLKAREQELLSALQELKESSERLQATQAQLIQSEKLGVIGQLASGVAHEVKNPLQIIVQGVDYLSHELRRSSNGQHAVAIHTIKEAIMRADKIVRELLSLSRPSTLELKPVALNRLLDAALNLVEKQLAVRNIQITKDVAPDLPSLLLDENQMKQVLINLILNAFQAMPTGGRLSLRGYTSTLTKVGDGVGRRADDLFKLGDRVVVCEIEDTGVGISAKALSKVFDPFYTTKPPGQGTGLGLTVTRTIVKHHGGSIRIESQEGRGTKAVLTFPLSVEKTDA